MRISVRAFFSDKHVFKLEDNDTVFTLKTLVSDKLQVKRSRLRLAFNRQELEDHHTLSHYNIKNNSLIILLFQLPGEKRVPLKFATP
jgi:hypothetical protein